MNCDNNQTSSQSKAQPMNNIQSQTNKSAESNNPLIQKERNDVLSSDKSSMSNNGITDYDENNSPHERSSHYEEVSEHAPIQEEYKYLGKKKLRISNTIAKERKKGRKNDEDNRKLSSSSNRRNIKQSPVKDKLSLIEDIGMKIASPRNKNIWAADSYPKNYEENEGLFKKSEQCSVVSENSEEEINNSNHMNVDDEINKSEENKSEEERKIEIIPKLDKLLHSLNTNYLAEVVGYIYYKNPYACVELPDNAIEVHFNLLDLDCIQNALTIATKLKSCEECLQGLISNEEMKKDINNDK